MSLRRQSIEGYKRYGSVDAGFFWYSGRAFGCIVALFLLLLPLTILVYGVWAVSTPNLNYEWTFLRLSILRWATTIAIILFIPLLPFRLWLLISAINNEKSKERDIIQEENGYKEQKPPWRSLSPNNVPYTNHDDCAIEPSEDTLKLVHILMDKKNHPSVLGYRDIQDIQQQLVGKDWWNDGGINDNYLVMVALFEEAGAMKRLTNSLSRLKYHNAQDNLRLLLLLEDEEHAHKEVANNIFKEQTLLNYEKKLQKKSEPNKDIFIKKIMRHVGVFFRLIAYIVVPMRIYKKTVKRYRKSVFGDPEEYNPEFYETNNGIQKDKIETTYQALIREIMTLPDPRLRLKETDRANSKIDIRRSFSIAFVPKVGHLKHTHLSEPQTKPRALNYGLYERFDSRFLGKNVPCPTDDTEDESFCGNAIRLQEHTVDENELEEFRKLVCLFKRLILQASCYHKVLVDICHSPDDNREIWVNKFKEQHQQDFSGFREKILGIFNNTKNKMLNDPEAKHSWLQLEKAINELFLEHPYRNPDYDKLKDKLLRAINKSRIEKKKKEKTQIPILDADDLGKLSPEIERILEDYRADYEGFQETVKDIIDCKVTVPFSNVDTDAESYLGGYLLKMMTGYFERYEESSAIDVEDLALLCLSENLTSTWILLHDLLKKHLNSLDKKRTKLEEGQATSEEELKPLLLPAFFDMDYSHDQNHGRAVSTLAKDYWKPCYCAVYDAEDRPEEDQLLKSVYTYKFYQFLPMLILEVLSNSLCVRVKTVKKMIESNPLGINVENLEVDASALRDNALKCIEELKGIRGSEASSREEIERYNKKFDEFIDNARELHIKLCKIETPSTYDLENPLLHKIMRSTADEIKTEYNYMRMYKYDNQDENYEELYSQDYFWWRAGYYFYDFLANKKHNEWQRYLDTAYPEREGYLRAFKNQVVCLQAKLTYENLNDNWLITLFKADYATWFNYLLPGLHAHNLPIPLGGTSNHFNMKFLSEVGAWDAFNVAEDCDLGMWIARAGKQVAVIESITWEVTNYDLMAWIKQRSRWNKGYMQSYFVHMRQPFNLWRELDGWKKFFSFQLTIGAGFLLPMLSALFYGMTFVYVLSLALIALSSVLSIPNIETPLFFINEVHYYWILPLGTGSLFISNVIFFLMLFIGHLRHPKPGSMRFIIIWWPLYWFFTVVASWRALYEYVFNPFHWDKSDHSYI